MSGVEGAERAPCVYMLYCTYSAAGGGEYRLSDHISAKMRVND